MYTDIPHKITVARFKSSPRITRTIFNHMAAMCRWTLSNSSVQRDLSGFLYECGRLYQKPVQTPCRGITGPTNGNV